MLSSDPGHCQFPASFDFPGMSSTGQAWRAGACIGSRACPAEESAGSAPATSAGARQPWTALKVVMAEPYLTLESHSCPSLSSSAWSAELAHDPMQPRAVAALLVFSIMNGVVEQGLASAHVPRYVQVTEVLAREIRDGRYAVGSLLPPEPQLCQRFAVSRHTVREAVRLLCEKGLLSRQQGVGTRVLASQGEQRYVASLSSLRDLMAYTQQTRLKYLESRWTVADAALMPLLRCQEGERWLELDTCRYPVDGGQPMVHMRIFVRPQCEGIQHALEDGDTWIYGLIEKYGGERILEAQQVVGAIAVPETSAHILGVEPKSPGLFVRRYYLGAADRLLSISLNVYPVDRFEFATSWRLEG